MSKPYGGGCLCGAVRYAIIKDPITVYNCHCTECQKVSTSAFGMSIRVNSDDFIIEGNLKFIKTIADSGRVKKGFFCPECGGRIFTKPAIASFIVVRAGTLDNPNWFSPIAHIWTKSAQKWFSFSDELPKFEQAPNDTEELNRLWKMGLVKNVH